MDAVEVLRKNADSAFQNVLEAINGVTERQAWARLLPSGDDYLHSDGSIHGLVLHIATGKFIYGSLAFRDSELRWRDMAQRIEKFEPSWSSAIEFLHEAHAYWMQSWSHLTSDQLEREVPHFHGRKEPTWKILQTVIHHDVYHAAQIVVIRFAAPESDSPPLSVAEDVRTYCSSLPSW